MGKKILFHILYWLFAWCLTVMVFGYGELFNRASLLYSSIILLVAAGVSYWISYFLIPRYLSTAKYGRFAAYLVFTIIISLDLELLVTLVFIFTLEKFQVETFFHDVREVYSLLTGTYFIVFLSVGIRLAQNWFLEESRKKDALRDKVEAELKLLKSQIHPHFLFNTLNNIYSLAMQKSDQAPDAVLKLSEMLDFLIYQSDERKLPLKREIDLIRNYIDLEKLRYGDRLQVNYRIRGDSESIQIVPLLFLPLVENAFKHGISPSRSTGKLQIRVEILENNVEFYIENSLPEKAPEENTGGIGLKNLHQRLELLYQDHYDMEIRKTDQVYSVLLKIQTGIP